jgi:hypothetical protein
VSSYGSGYDHGVPRASPVRSRSKLLLEPADACRVDEHPVRLAAFHHLGVAGDYGNAGGRAGVGHGVEHPVQNVERQAFLEDEAGRQAQGRGSHHGQIVDRAVHRQVPDVTPGKLQRADDERVRRHGDLAARHVHDRGVAERRQDVVREARKEPFPEQSRAQLPA